MYKRQEQCTVKCTAITLRSWPCGHVNETACHVDPTQTACKAPCGENLKCDHPCAGKFGRVRRLKGGGDLVKSSTRFIQ